MLDVVVITGPCGVGKSTVGFECLQILERAGVPAAFVDGELVYVHPKPAGDPFGYSIAEPALRALWGVYEKKGFERLLLARVVEDDAQRAIVERALPNARLRIFRLVAAATVVRERLARREIGSALPWHERRAEEIARATLGEPVDAARPVDEVAREVLTRAGWLRP